MAFSNIAGRAGFVLELDKTQLDRGLPAASREFDTATARMAQSADRAGRAIGDAGAGGGVGLAGRLGSMGALLGRAGLFGVGITAAVQLNRQLTSSLEVTGTEAFTTEGKIRNMASALMSGDIVGGIKALSAVPQTLEQWGVSADEAVTHFDAFKALAADGGPFAKLAQQAVDLADGVRIAATAADALNFSLRQTNVLASGAQIPVGLGPEEGGPGAIAAAQAAKAATGGTTSGGGRPAARAIGPSARLQARLTVAQATGDLDEVLRLQTVQRDRLAKALENSHGNVEQRTKLNQQLAAATAAVIGTQNAIDAQAKAEAATAARAREAARAEQERDRQEEVERRRRAREAALRARLEDAESISIGAKEQLEGRFPLGESRLRRIDPERLREATATEQPVTLAEIRRMQFEFLQGLQGMTNQFAGNLTPDGAQTASNTWRTSKLTEQMVRGIDRLTRGVQHPGAKYARLELMEPFGGVGSI